MALDDIFQFRRDYFRLRLLLHICRWRKGLFNCGFSLLILTGAFLVLWMLHPDNNADTSSAFNIPIIPIRNRSSLMTMSPGRSVVHPHHFHYIINEPHLCLEKRFILIFVTSSPENEERRMAIRKTWGSSSHLKLWRAAVIFLLGAVVDQRLQKQIREESMSYRDVLQEDFVDSYRNLTLKSVMALKWSSNYCPGVRYVLKTDDDIYVNVPLLMSFLKLKVNKKRWIVGCIKQHVGLPMKIEGGRPVSSAISFPGHPPFVAGAGYVISGDLVEDLYVASLKVRFIPVEDVFVTGHCSRAVGVRPQHDGRFSCGELVGDDCVMKDMFTGHKIFPKEQFQIWNTIYFENARRCVS